MYYIILIYKVVETINTYCIKGIICRDSLHLSYSTFTVCLLHKLSKTYISIILYDTKTANMK